MIQLFFWVSELSEIRIVLGYFLLSCCGGVLGWLCKAGHKSSPLARAEYAALIFSAQFVFTCPQAAFVLGGHAIAYNLLPLLFAVTFGAAILNGYFLYSFSHRRGADISPGKINTIIAFIPFGILYYCFAAGDKYNNSQKHPSTANLNLGTAALVIWALIMYGGTQTVEASIETLEAPELSPAQQKNFNEHTLDGLGFEAYYRYISEEDLTSLPFQLDKGLWLLEIVIKGDTITYVHEVKAGFYLTHEELDLSQEWVCTGPFFAAPLAKGGTIVHSYYETDDTLILEFKLQESDCVSQI